MTFWLNASSENRSQEDGKEGQYFHRLELIESLEIGMVKIKEYTKRFMGVNSAIIC